MCGHCAELCPGPVFTGRPQYFPHIATIGESRLASNRTDCQACRDACPVEAIRLGRRPGGPFLPELDEGACTGCGACIAVCPVTAIGIHRVAPEVSDVRSECALTHIERRRRHAAACQKRVVAQLGEMDNVEVFAHRDGKIVVTIEGTSTGMLGEICLASR
ncbi:NAD-dependent dihydropyrimidine dehydrogenase PreA subunit (plasmid) [Ensifer sp. WSM1721]